MSRPCHSSVTAADHCPFPADSIEMKRWNGRWLTGDGVCSSSATAAMVAADVAVVFSASDERPSQAARRRLQSQRRPPAQRPVDAVIGCKRPQQPPSLSSQKVDEIGASKGLNRRQSTLKSMKLAPICTSENPPARASQTGVILASFCDITAHFPINLTKRHQHFRILNKN